jgi:hypothetical protein
MTNDEPGLPATDEEKAALMLRLVSALDTTSADGRAGLGAIMRELAAIDPEAIQRLNAAIEIRQARTVSSATH